MSEFENRAISRRDAIRLAKFGALLATGLTITREASAFEPQNVRSRPGEPIDSLQAATMKGEAGSLVIKLYSGEATQTLKLIGTIDLAADLVLKQNLTNPSAFTFKVLKVGATGATASFSHTIKLSEAGAITLKLTSQDIVGRSDTGAGE